MTGFEDFEAVPSAEAVSMLRACADVRRWAEALVAGRPYADPATLLLAADDLAATWTDAEVEQALADHPRIGEKHAGDGASAAHSSREQAAVGDDADVRRRLVEGNLAYEARFGRVFLVRAAGRDAEEILALLEQRLAHDPATELAVTAGQLREIAALRLEDLLT